MSIEAATAAGALVAPELRVAQAPYGASITDAVQFQGAMHAAANFSIPAGGTEPLGGALKGAFDQLEVVNGQASSLAAHARAAEAKGAAVTPGEMIQLTVQCHEFMFSCQLTSNIANRMSDGLQQLFRQQS